jgi:hypothetical protein
MYVTVLVQTRPYKIFCQSLSSIDVALFSLSYLSEHKLKNANDPPCYSAKNKQVKWRIEQVLDKQKGEVICHLAPNWLKAHSVVFI